MDQATFEKLLNKPGIRSQPGNAPFFEKKPAASFHPIPHLPPATDNTEVIRKSIRLGIQPSTDEQKLNKTERTYLAWLRTLNDLWIGIQCVTLKIGDDCRYTPDFAALDGEGLRFIDTKATNRKTGKPLCQDDALVKMRVAARLFPWARFLIAHPLPSGWQHIEIKP